MAKHPSFPIGHTVKVSAEFRVGGVLTEPTTVVLTVEEPDGTNNLPSVNNDGTGLRSASFTTDQSGWHRYKWVSTGPAAGVQESAFYAHTSGIV